MSMYKMKNISTLVLIFALVIFIIVFFSIRVVKEGFAVDTVQEQARDYQTKINDRITILINQNINDDSIKFSDLLPLFDNSKLVSTAINNDKLNGIDKSSVNQYYLSIKSDIQKKYNDDMVNGIMSKLLTNLNNTITQKLNNAFFSMDDYINNKGYSSN